MKIKRQQMESWIVWIFLFCYFMEFIAFLDIWTVIGGTAICAILYARHEKLRIDVLTCLLGVTIFLYFGLDKSIGIACLTPFTYIVPIIFITAHYLAHEVKKQEEENRAILLLILAMALGLTIHGLLNSIMFLDKQWLNGVNRIWMDFWSGEYKYAAWQNSYFLPAMAMAFPGVLYFRERKIVNVFLILSSFFFLYISIVSESRVTTLMFPIIVFAQMILYVLLERKKLVGKFSKKQILIAVGMSILVIIVAAILFVNSSLGQKFLGIMGRDGGIFNNVRFKFQRHALGQLFMYPLGGRQMDFLGYGHAHNAWIDIADAAGVIPFFAFVAYTIISFFELFRLLKNEEISTEIKLIVAGIYFAFVMFFTIESALESYDHYITPWIFIQGLIHGYLEPLKFSDFKRK